MKEYGFPAHLRLKRTADFEQVYDKGRRLGDGHLLLFAWPSVPGAIRAGFSVSRKHGNAVHRNRRKRLLREAFRLHRVQLPAGYDFVLVPRQRDDSTLQDYSRSLVSLARRLHRQFMMADRGPDGNEPGRTTNENDG